MDKMYILWDYIRKSLIWLLRNPIALIALGVIVLLLLSYNKGVGTGYDKGYAVGYKDGFSCIDTVVDTVPMKPDTIFIPAPVDTSTTPATVSAIKAMSRDGYVKVKYTFPPTSMFEFEIKEPAPIYVEVPKIVETEKPVLDWQKGCMFSAGGMIIGLSGMIGIIYLLR